MEIMARMDWSGGRDAQAQPVNAVLVQRLGDEIVLSFGHAPPPIPTATLSGEELVKYFEANPVPVQQISRFTLPLKATRQLLKGMEQILGDDDSEEEEAS